MGKRGGAYRPDAEKGWKSGQPGKYDGTDSKGGVGQNFRLHNLTNRVGCTLQYSQRGRRKGGEGERESQILEVGNILVWARQDPKNDLEITARGGEGGHRR